jgi:hypothetical protein
MLGMTTPIVTELPLRLEPVTADSFMELTHEDRVHDHVMNYIECDLAAELTLPQWGRARASSPSRRSLRGIFAQTRRPAALAA